MLLKTVLPNTAQVNRILFIGLLLLSALRGFTQRCDNKNFCDKELYGEFDFRSQSNYAQVNSGDSVRVKVVVYAKQSYRMFTCCDKNLKEVDFRIIYPEKRFKRVIKEIETKDVPIYQKDKSGNFVLNKDGEKIMTGTIYAADTVWSRELVTSESVVYDSREAEEKYWDVDVHKTRLIIIEVIVPEKRKKKSGCIQIMVGRKYETSGQFRL